MYTLRAIRLRLTHCARLTALIALYLLLFITLYVCLDVLFRKTIGLSLAGGDELSGYAMAIAIGWAATYTLYQGGFIRVDFLYRRLPVRLQAWSDVLGTFLSAVFAVILTYYSLRIGIESYEFDVVSNTPLRVMLWAPQFAWATGFIFLTISTTLLFVEALIAALRGDHAGVIRTINPHSDGR